jgi:hypothetical protein
MDLRFHHIVLPDHSRVFLDASPMAWDKKYLTRNGDGRMVAKEDVRKQQNDVIGGAVGGFIVGSIFHRRITGTILGAIIGSAAAQSDRERDTNLVVRKGDKVGALINEPLTIRFPMPPGFRDRYETNRRLDRDMAVPSRSRGAVGLPERESHYNIFISYHDKQLVFPEDAIPYRVGRDIIVPLEPVARQLGLDVDRRPNGSVYIDGPDSNLRVNIGSREARLDGNHIDLARPVLDKNGVLYLPLDALLPLVKDPVFLNGTRLDHG